MSKQEETPAPSFPDPSTNTDSQQQFRREAQQKSYLSSLPSFAELPKCDNFRTTPRITQLSRMTRDELSSVGDFVIENSFGKIEFTHPISLLDQDLDKLINIGQNIIEVDDSLAVKGCVLHFYNFGNYLDKVRETDASKNFMKKLYSWAKTNKLKIIEFVEDTGELVATYDM